jgi:sortase A
MAEYPAEIAKLLRLGEVVVPNGHTTLAEASQPVQNPVSKPMAGGFVPGDLPIVDLDAELNKPLADRVVESILQDAKPDYTTMPAVPGKPTEVVMPAPTHKSEPAAAKPFSVKRLFKGLVMYPAIFVVSFAFFYVLFNFSSLVSQVNAWFIKPEDEVVLDQDLGPFYSWIQGYYFAVVDKTLLEPNNDVDKDGLSNLDEYIIRTNPTIADSDGDGKTDGTEVMNSTNPWGKGSMTADQLKLREQMDIIKINNRISFNTASVADQTLADPGIDYDFSKPGRLSIPRLNMQVPLIWTQDPSQFDTDLTKGVVHYPGTALPGEKGTVYISGHSSDYFWKTHPYKQVFAKINVLQPGDDIFVDIYGKDGKTYTYRYQVSEKNVFKPDDQSQFIDNSQYKLNLSTCWPIGTQRDRYVVSATMVPL